MQGFFGLLCIQFYWFVWRVAKAVHHGRNVKYVLEWLFQVVAMCFSRRNGGFWSVHKFCHSTCFRHGRPPHVTSLFSLLPFTALSCGPGVIAARLLALATGGWSNVSSPAPAHLHQRRPKGHLLRWQYMKRHISTNKILHFQFAVWSFSVSDSVVQAKTLYVSNNWFQVMLNG